ncbi:MAG: transcriptional regulator NrdR [Rhodobacteraceae bacterium]|nr:transcriptional regulator NrdR [Paracoccaceae bacterium]
MRCPFCMAPESQVKDTRPIEEKSVIRRRRSCLTCGGRFTTYERLQIGIQSVIKSDGRQQNFDREKLKSSLVVALHKRGIDGERINQIITGIIRRLEESGETEISTRMIGRHAMESLESIDTVAYVRFASVYKNFQMVDDFESFVSEIRPGNEDDGRDGSDEQ